MSPHETQAVLVHGVPRLTEDIDVTVGLDPAGVQTITDVCRALTLEALPEDVERFVLETFVLPAKHAEIGIRVDFVFSTTPYERQAIDRAVLIPVGDAEVPFATAEDLIIHKLFAGRARDLEDVAGVLRRKGHELDWDYLEKWAAQFAGVPGREDFRERVEDLRKRWESERE